MAPVAEHLVGRGDALGSLERILDAVARGQPGAVEVSGEPGIGKSRLLMGSPPAPRRAVTWFYPGPRRSSSVTCRSLSSLMRWTSTSPAWSHIALPNWTVRSRQSSGMSSRRFGPSPALARVAPQQERYQQPPRGSTTP